MIREFDRIDGICKSYSLPVTRSRGKFVDSALLYTTPVWLCGLASRLSHESHIRATPETDDALLKRLITRGEQHAKSMRGKQYYVLIEAPRYFWAEMDTYTVGVISLGSTSTMHKEGKGLKGLDLVEAKSALPEGTLQCRMKVFSFQALNRIIYQRNDHRLPEWQEFCEFAQKCIDSY